MPLGTSNVSADAILATGTGPTTVEADAIINVAASSTVNVEADAIVVPPGPGAIKGVVPVLASNATAQQPSSFAVAGLLPAGPSIDPGWPASGNLVADGSPNLVFGAPATSGTNRLIALCVSGQCGGTAFPVTVTGLGLAWTRIAAADAITGAITADIWAAWASAALPAGSITVQTSSSASKSVQAVAYAFSGTMFGGTSLASCFGASAVTHLLGGGSGPRATSLSGSNSSSALLISLVGAGATLAEYPYSLWDGSLVDGSAGYTAAGGRYALGTGTGTITFGADGIGTDYLAQAIEVLGFSEPAETSSLVLDRYPEPRQTWRSGIEVITPPLGQPPPPVTSWYLGPDWLIPIWNPERSHVNSPIGPETYWVVLPDQPPPPLLPERYIRTAWNPDRGVVVEPRPPSIFLVIVPEIPVPPLLPEAFLRPLPPSLWHGFQEVYPATPDPVPDLWAFEGPPGFLRFVWDPEKGWISYTVGPHEQTTVLPPWPLPAVLPDAFSRPDWNPPRSDEPRSLEPIIVPAPDFPPPPTLPEFFARPPWDPIRSAETYPTGLGPLERYCFISAPGTAYVNVPFRVRLHIFNPEAKPFWVAVTDPYFLPATVSGTMGIPWFSGPRQDLRPPDAALANIGLVKVASQSQIAFELLAVVFAPGTIMIGADVWSVSPMVIRSILFPSLMTASPAIITVVPL
jgi:hypothetical protein